MNINEILKYHKLNIDKDLIKHLFSDCDILSFLGLSEEDLSRKNEQQIIELIVGEYFAKIASIIGKLASEYLLKAQWGYGEPEWFDHRHHILYPEKHFNDFWTASSDNVIKYLPVGGKLLDLCSGDGFYDYYFYRKRASVIKCDHMCR